MRTYVFKRLVLFIPTLLIVTVLVFGILRVVPGDPAMLILGGESGDDEFTEEQLAALRKKLGTDRNIIIQYFTWTGNMLKGDFGTSYFYEGDQVIDDLIDRVPTTVELALLALVLATVMAVPLGVISALKQDTITDYVTRVLSITGIATPNFRVAIMTIFFLVFFLIFLRPFSFDEYSQFHYS